MTVIAEVANGGLTADDRAMLADSVARFAAQHYRFEQRLQRLAEAEKTGHSAAWVAIAELGLLALLVPEAQGGLGGTIADAGVAMAEIGRSLIVEPYLSTAIIAAPLLAELDPDDATADFAGIMSGDRIVTLAAQEPDLGYARGPLATYAAPSGNGWALTGAKSAVLDGPIADVLLVTALDPERRVGLFAVEAVAAAPGMTRHHTVDSRTLGEFRFAAVPAVRLGDGDAAPAIGRALARAAIATAFEAAGSMAVLVDATGEHIRTRRAFGGTLAQFQVLRHRLVDMFIAAQEVRALAEATADAHAADPDASEAAVSALKVHLCRAARTVAEGAVQLHGGMGMTDELMVSHHFKRLMMVEALFGDAEFHLDRYVALSGGGIAA